MPKFNPFESEPRSQPPERESRKEEAAEVGARSEQSESLEIQLEKEAERLRNNLAEMQSNLEVIPHPDEVRDLPKDSLTLALQEVEDLRSDANMFFWIFLIGGTLGMMMCELPGFSHVTRELGLGEGSLEKILVSLGYGVTSGLFAKGLLDGYRKLEEWIIRLRHRDTKK